VVRSTRPCILVVTHFVQERQYCRPREDKHKAKWPLYPHPSLYVSHTQQLFFRTGTHDTSARTRCRTLEYAARPEHPCVRNEELRHLRFEQLIRYFSTAGSLSREEETIEDTVEMDDEAVMCDQNHRHYDLKCEKMVPGTKFPSRAQGLEVLQRRRQARLAVSRIPFLEPLGAKRENYHQQNPRELVRRRDRRVFSMEPDLSLSLYIYIYSPRPLGSSCSDLPGTVRAPRRRFQTGIWSGRFAGTRPTARWGSDHGT